MSSIHVTDVLLTEKIHQRIEWKKWVNSLKSRTEWLIHKWLALQDQLHKYSNNCWYICTVLLAQKLHSALSRALDVVDIAESISSAVSETGFVPRQTSIVKGLCVLLIHHFHLMNNTWVCRDTLRQQTHCRNRYTHKHWAPIANNVITDPIN